MRLAYADPPYLGCARYYDHPESWRFDFASAHAEVLASLDANYDGWAFSLHVPSLPELLPWLPDGARIGSWVKSFAAFKKNVRIAYAWEPVFWKPARDSSEDGASVGRDFLICPIAMEKGLIGAKPEPFCRWILDLMGFVDGDTVDDLFPGTGILGDVVAKRRLL